MYYFGVCIHTCVKLGGQRLNFFIDFFNYIFVLGTRNAILLEHSFSLL